MKRIHFFLLICLLFFGCQVVEPPPVSVLSSSPDTRFTGNWESISYGERVYDQYAFYEYSFLTIDDSNKLFEHKNREELGNQVHGYPANYNLEWKIENDRFVTREWNNPYANWIAWDFLFPDSTHMILSRMVNSRSIVLNYTKQ